MTIVITDADNAIYMTKSEYKYWEDLYDHEYRNYFGAVPTLEEFVRRRRQAVKTTPVKEPVKSAAEIYRNLSS